MCAYMCIYVLAVCGPTEARPCILGFEATGEWLEQNSVSLEEQPVL